MRNDQGSIPYLPPWTGWSPVLRELEMDPSMNLRVF